jgi:hypothetical protein
MVMNYRLEILPQKHLMVNPSNSQLVFEGDLVQMLPRCRSTLFPNTMLCYPEKIKQGQLIKR